MKIELTLQPVARQEMGTKAKQPFQLEGVGEFGAESLREAAEPPGPAAPQLAAPHEKVLGPRRTWRHRGDAEKEDTPGSALAGALALGAVTKPAAGLAPLATPPKAAQPLAAALIEQRAAARPEAPPPEPAAPLQAQMREPAKVKAEPKKPAEETPARPAAAQQPFEVRGGSQAEASAVPRQASPPALPLPTAAETQAPYLVLGAGGARLSVDTGEAGAISVRIDVRDGTADLRAAGAAAPLLASHTGDLRAALAAEGLRLGALDVDDRSASWGGGGAGANDRGAPDGDPHERRAAHVPRPASTPAQARNGRLHVKA